jgi:hypothetical protein
MIASIGAGPAPIPHKKLSAGRLASAIKFALSPGVLAAAQKASERIAKENGVVSGAQSFHRHLPLDKMKCDVDPLKLARFYIAELDLKVSQEVSEILLRNKKISEKQLLFFRYKIWEPEEVKLQKEGGESDSELEVMSETKSNKRLSGTSFPMSASILNSTKYIGQLSYGYISAAKKRIQDNLKRCNSRESVSKNIASREYPSVKNETPVEIRYCTMTDAEVIEKFSSLSLSRK